MFKFSDCSGEPIRPNIAQLRTCPYVSEKLNVQSITPNFKPSTIDCPPLYTSEYK